LLETSSNGQEDYLDVKTVEFSDKGPARLWLKSVNKNRTYAIQSYDFGCKAKRLNRKRQSKPIYEWRGCGDEVERVSENHSGTRSRRHRSRTEADQLAVEYEAGGLSREEFCNQRNVALKTLARYVTRYRKQQAESNPQQNTQPQRWVAVELAGQGG